MKVLLFFILCAACGIAMQSEHCERILGHELSEKDKENFIKLGSGFTVTENEMVAIKFQDTWLYARVQSLPLKDLGLGIVNLRPMNPNNPPEGNNYGGFVIHFRHVRKLVS